MTNHDPAERTMTDLYEAVIVLRLPARLVIERAIQSAISSLEDSDRICA